MWKRRLILILALVAVVGLVAARPDASRDLGRRGWEKVKALLFRIRPRPKEIQLPDIVPVVRIKQIGSAKFVRMRQYYGEIKPNREARLLFEVPGRIQKIHFRENAFVDTNKPLAELDPALFITRRDRERANLEKAERDLKRSQALSKKKFVSQRSLQDAETAVRLSRARLQDAITQLNRTKLYSPFPGYLVRLNVELGEIVSVVYAGEAAFTVMALDPVKLVVWVPEYRVPELAGDQECTIRMPAFPERLFKGRVKRVPLASQKQGRLFGVEILIANKAHALRPGMIASAHIETLTLPRAWRFPIDWVRRSARGLEVFVFEPDAEDKRQGRMRAVKLIRPFRDGSHWVARSLEGVSQDSTLSLVTAGFEGLEDGRKVRRLK